MKKILTVITVAVFAFTWVSCTPPKGLKYQDIETLRIRKDKQYPFLVYVRMYNPNKFPLEIKYGNIETFIEDQPLGEIKLDTVIKVAGKGTLLLPLGYNPDYLNMFPNPDKQLAKQEQNIKVNGSIAVERKGKFYVTAIRYQGDMDQAQ